MRQGGVARGQSEGVHVPQVHAFNVLRATFQDKELSTETTSFAARGLEVSIRGRATYRFTYVYIWVLLNLGSSELT